MHPFVSIIIPAYNASATIQQCLEAILNQDYPNDRYEIIVVDNNSTDITPDIVSQFPVCLTYEREIQGPHAATNAGVLLARGEILAFTDSDCVPVKHWLRELVAPFADDNVVATGGKIEAYHPESRVEKFLETMQPFQNCLRLSESFPVSIITANAAYRAEAFRSVGMFNPNLYTGAEVDLSWRIQLSTKKKVVYVPEAIVNHKFRSNIRRLFRHFKIYGYSEIILGTIYKDIPDYPITPRVQLRRMLKQLVALITYILSIIIRPIKAVLHGRDIDYVLWPFFWIVVESGSVIGKILGLWETRFYRKQFWMDGPHAI